MNRTAQRQLLAVLLTVFLLFSYLTGYISRGMISHAAAVAGSYEESAVFDDLKGSTIGGKTFDLKDYPAVKGADPELLLFTEYCYSSDAALQKNYALYAYVYNPGEIAFDVGFVSSSYFSKIQLSFGGNGYVKYMLRYLNQSTASDGCAGRFYKFRVILSDAQRTEAISSLYSGERIYKISGFELRQPADVNATEYEVSQTYKYSGFVKGYGPGAAEESTLKCTLDGLETVKLDVRHTFYRTKTSELGAGYQKELDTVYFSVPKRLFDDYGTLQRIKAEWYEYKTKPIVVTSNERFYNAAKDYIGVKLSTKSPYYNSNVGYGIGTKETTSSAWGNKLYTFQGMSWNIPLDASHVPAPQNLDTLYYLLPTANWCDIDIYDPYAENIQFSGGITSNALYEYIKNYKSSSEAEDSVQIKGGLLPAELFESDIDESRKLDNESGKIDFGYSYYDFDADVDLQTLRTWNDTKPKWWETAAKFGFWNTLFGKIPEETGKTLAPIYVLGDTDMSVSDTVLIDNLLVNAKDVSAIRNAYNNAKNNDEYLVLFRFAVSDYYSEAASILKEGIGLLETLISGEAYIAQKSVFFDFDIIQLTFKRESVETVVPVIMSPMDIIPDVTPPPILQPGIDGFDWQRLLRITLGIIIAILFFVVIYKLIKFASRRRKS